MKKFEHIRNKAVELRKKGLSLPAICERLQFSKTTVYYWIRGITPTKTILATPASKSARDKVRARATKAMQAKYTKLRDSAYADAFAAAPALFANSLFRDFINIYLTEGLRRSRSTGAIANSNPNIIRLSHYWLKRLSTRDIKYALQYHADQNLDEVLAFWSGLLKIKAAQIRLQRKSNSGKLTGRSWRSKYGVLTVFVCDTYFRSKLQAWMDYLESTWTVS